MALLKTILEETRTLIEPRIGTGRVADYIPALARVDPHKFGIAVVDLHGKVTALGDAYDPFSIQSISKVFTLTLALGKRGDDLWKRVGREPSGSPFNSIVQLEQEHGIPRNITVGGEDAATFHLDLRDARLGRRVGGSPGRSPRQYRFAPG